jgi:hypothetical protein
MFAMNASQALKLTQMANVFLVVKGVVNAMLVGVSIVLMDSIGI